MNKKIPVFLFIITIAFTVVITFNLTYIIITNNHEKQLNSIISEYSSYNDIIQFDKSVRSNYCGTIDEDKLRDYLFAGYISGIGDKYATYMTAGQWDEFQQEEDGHFVGIGISVIADSDNIEIIDVFENSPAAVSGLQIGDLIIKVNENDVKQLGYDRAVEMIRGEIGTEVSLTLSRDGNIFECKVARQDIVSSTISYHVYKENSNIGVIRITGFNNTTINDFQKAAESLKKSCCDRFIFDVRNNGGGSLDSVVSVLDYILPVGPITSIRFANGNSEKYESDSTWLNADYAVLVNANTASAAELFSCSIQDYANNGQLNAKIIGTGTYGKGVLQSFYKLSSGAAYKITTAYYDPPYSENYDGKGVIPDIVLDLDDEAKKINFNKLTDYNDNQLTAAAEYLNQR